MTGDKFISPSLEAQTPIHYINGQWQKGHSKELLSLINPSDETIYGTMALASLEQAQQAIDAANSAFPSWSSSSKETRYEFVQKLLSIYESQQDIMAKAVSLEMGAPIDFAYNAQTIAGAKNIRTFLKIFEEFQFEGPLSKQDPEAKLLLKPLGAVGLITPWNWPIHQITIKVVAALLAGCTMVLKPSEVSPLSALLFAKMIEQTDLPPGVFNLIHGKGPIIGRYLSAHESLNMISFTGSTLSGRDIVTHSVQNLKRVTLELGGKGANILLEDCDDKALERAVWQIMRNSGQSCNAPSRLLLPISHYESFLAKIKTIAHSVLVDKSDKKGNHIGPLSSQKQYDHARDLINSAFQQGAKCLCGGQERPAYLEKGYYIQPTIFYDVTPSMRIFQEEIFAPVLSITPFSSIEEAIQLANQTNYGLTNYVQTQNKSQAFAIAKRLESGMVEINGNFLPEDSFFGGIKASGQARERGIMGIEEYCYSQAISAP